MVEGALGRGQVVDRDQVGVPGVGPDPIGGGSRHSPEVVAAGGVDLGAGEVAASALEALGPDHHLSPSGGTPESRGQGLARRREELSGNRSSHQEGEFPELGARTAGRSGRGRIVDPQVVGVDHPGLAAGRPEARHVVGVVGGVAQYPSA